MATTGETLNITNAYEDKRFNREVDLMTGYKTSTLLCMPIYIKDRIIGVVELVNKKGGVFTRKDEQACTAISLHLSNHSNHHNWYIYIFGTVAHILIFKYVLASVYEGLSVGWLVGRSDGRLVACFLKCQY